MSTWLRNFLLLGLGALPTVCEAQSLALPGLGPDLPYPRPGYRDEVFPPPQVGLLGQPLPPTGSEMRPTYRQMNDQFPPAPDRYGTNVDERVVNESHFAPLSALGIAPTSYAGQFQGGPVYAPAASEAPAYAAPQVYGGYGAQPYQPAGQVYAPSPRRASLPKGRLPEYLPDMPAAGGPQAAAAPPASAYTASAAAEGYGAPQNPLALPLASLFQPATSQPVVYNAPSGRDPYDPAAVDPGLATRPVDPAYGRQMVAYGGSARPGTIIIDTPNKFLYLVQPGAQAIRYGIGVGRPGFTWRGNKRITRKAEWPGWTPPREMIHRRPDLPRHMEGGMANPLGARALYLGSSLYRIHGTNEPYTIGTNVSSGCIRMMNQDVIDLYNRVGIGTQVVVL